MASHEETRRVPATHGLRPNVPDPPHEVGLAADLREKYDRVALVELFARFSASDGAFDTMMRRVLFRAIAKRVGDGLHVGAGVGFKHLETFEIGHNVFLGAGAYLQGRFDGRCVIGDRVWIGPQAYMDARDLEIEDDVGWAPCARVLGSVHSGAPAGVPVIQTDLVIAPVRVRASADVGIGATLLPGVTVGKGAIVGAGAVVIEDVPPNAVVAGVPARVLRYRDAT